MVGGLGDYEDLGPGWCYDGKGNYGHGLKYVGRTRRHTLSQCKDYGRSVNATAVVYEDSSKNCYAYIGIKWCTIKWCTIL